MHSIPRALMWELFSHGRWWIPGYMILGNLFPMLLLAFFVHLGVDPDDHAFVVLHQCFVPVMICSFGAGIISAQGSLTRLYTAPISTASLVAWHMFPGAILLAVEVAAAAWCYNTLYRFSWPILGPALLAAALWASVQLLVSMSQRTLTGTCLAAAPALILLAWFGSRYGAWFGPAKRYWSAVTPVEFATLFGVITIAFVVTTAAVGRDRSGEPLPSLGVWKWLMRKWDAFTATTGKALQPFRSASDAQFWYEWTLWGPGLPLAVVLGYVFGVSIWLLRIVVGHGTDEPLAELLQVILSGGGMLSLVAMVAGVLSSVPSTGSSRQNHSTNIRDIGGRIGLYGMGHFLSTRPFTNSDFARSIQKTAIRTVLIAWGLWFAGFAVCFLIGVLTQSLPAQLFPPEIGFWYFPLTLLGPWITMTNAAAIGLTGRGAKLILIGVTTLISWCIGLILIRVFISREVHDQFLKICLQIGAIAILVATPLLFTIAHRQNLMNRKSQWVAAFVFAGIVILAIELSPGDFSISVLIMIAAFSALAVVPLATIPLAIAWNRHR